MFKNFVNNFNFHISLPNGDGRLEGNSDSKSSGMMVATANDNGYQEWTAFESKPGSGTFYLKNNRHDRLLDCGSGNVYCRSESHFPPKSRNDYQLWTIEQPDWISADAKAQYQMALKNCHTNTYLTMNPKGELIVALPDNLGNDKQTWIVEMSRVKFNAGEATLICDPVKTPLLTYDTVWNETLDNDGPISQTTPYKRTITESHEFMWNLTETVGVSLSVTAQGGLPGVAKASATATVSLDVSSTQQVTTSESIEYDFEADIQGAPFSRAYVECILGQAKDFPITGRIRFPLTAMYTGNNAEIAPDTLATIVKAMALSSGRVAAPSGVVIELPCKATGGYAFSSKLKVQAIATNISLSPNEGKKDDYITLSGTGVKGASSVVFHYHSDDGDFRHTATFLSSLDADSIQVKVPEFAPGFVPGATNVTVTVVNGEVSSDPADFTYAL